MGKGRAPCCEKVGLNKGSWTPEEDLRLIAYIRKYGHGNWRALPKLAGLLRCGKSCRLRWINYLRPDIKRGNFSKEEEDSIIKLHALLGNKWSKIASCLPGRTDNEIKNVWNTYLKKRIRPDQQLQMDRAQDNSCSPTSSCTSLTAADQVENKNNSTTEEEQTNPICSLEALMEILPIEQGMDMWNVIDQDHEPALVPSYFDPASPKASVPISSSSSYSSSSSSEIFFKTDLSDQDQNGALEDPFFMMDNMPDLLMLELPEQEDLSMITSNDLHSVMTCIDDQYSSSSKEWMEYLEKELGLGDHELLHHESMNCRVDMVDEDPVSSYFQKETSWSNINPLELRMPS